MSITGMKCSYSRMIIVICKVVGSRLQMLAGCRLDNSYDARMTT